MADKKQHDPKQSDSPSNPNPEPHREREWPRHVREWDYPGTRKKGKKTEENYDPGRDNHQPDLPEHYQQGPTFDHAAVDSAEDNTRGGLPKHKTKDKK